MRFHALVREVQLDTSSGASRAGVLALVSILLLCGLAVAESASISTIAERAVKFREAGATIFVLNAPSQISGSACDALDQSDNERTSGAIRSVDPIEASLLPASPIPVWEATGGILTMLDADVRGVGVLVGPGVRSVFGESVDRIARASEAVPIGGSYSYPDDGRPPRLDYAVLAEATQAGVFDQCWLRVRSDGKDSPSVLLTALLPGYDDDQGPDLSQLNPSLGRSFDLNAELGKRTTRFAPLVALVGGLLFGIAGIYSRRLNLASALHAGATRFALASICLLESAVWAIGSVASVMLFAQLASLPIDLSHRHIFGTSVMEIGLLYSVGVASGALVSVGLIGERRLFAYFKGTR